LLVAERISKTFYGNRVLNDFTLRVESGEVHAILGHNGSGKSTFVKILSGFHTPDSGGGNITVDSRRLRFGDPHSGAEAGVRIVHQGLGLIGSLTVLENLRLGVGTYTTTRLAGINWTQERRRARKDLSVLGLTTSPDARLDSLSAVEQTEVAIARAVQDGQRVRCLVLDEPTAALPESEVERLFAVIDPLRALGVSLLYITHRLGEVHAIASHVSVLRDGNLVAQGEATAFSRAKLLDLIAGGDGSVAPSAEGSAQSALGAGGLPRQPASEQALHKLELREVTTRTLNGLSLSAASGDVVGIVSLVGAGVEEIPRVLRGDTPFTGSVFLDGKPLDLSNPHAAQLQGIIVVPSKTHEKVAESMSVRENLTLGLLRRFWRRFRLDTRAEHRFASYVIDRFRIRCSNVDVPVKTLSGGNRQKLVVARALERNPRVLILDEPTQGVDVAGKTEILSLLSTVAQSGVPVLICSSDLDEIAESCTRAVVLHKGQVSADLRQSEITRERIVRECNA
jgi:ribose transport system ATP-binding protein